MKEIFELLKDFKHSLPVIKVNKLKIPVTVLEPTEENTLLMDKLLVLLQKGHIKQYVETPSKGISIKFKNRLEESWHWDPKWRELTLLLLEGNWRIQLVSKEMRDHPGRRSWAKFVKACEANDVELDKYALEPEKAIETKQRVPKPIIQLCNSIYKDLIFTNVHHLDFNSSYPSELCKAHPEFKPVLEPWYKKRKEDPSIKQDLVNITGCMYGLTTQYRFSNLAAEMIGGNNQRIIDYCKKLIKAGCEPLVINTDGIWYTGNIYHDEYEGKELGQWKNDHINCTFRAKSAGCYEFIENDKYTAVVRRLEQGKIAECEKQWGMIYKDELLQAEYALPYVDNNNYYRVKWTKEYIV